MSCDVGKATKGLENEMTEIDGGFCPKFDLRTIGNTRLDVEEEY